MTIYKGNGNMFLYMTFRIRGDNNIEIKMKYQLVE